MRRRIFLSYTAKIQHHKPKRRVRFPLKSYRKFAILVLAHLYMLCGRWSLLHRGVGNASSLHPAFIIYLVFIIPPLYKNGKRIYFSTKRNRISAGKNLAICFCICYNADRQLRSQFFHVFTNENPGAATPGFSFRASCHDDRHLTT